MSTLVEQEKYKYDRMWDYPGYKFWNGPDRVTKFMNKCFTGKHSVLEFGCGTGMNSLTMHNQGHDVWMMDITDHSLLRGRDGTCADGLGVVFIRRDQKESRLLLLPDLWCR